MFIYVFIIIFVLHISNQCTSVKQHWLRYCHCTKLLNFYAFRTWTKCSAWCIVILALSSMVSLETQPSLTWTSASPHEFHRTRLPCCFANHPPWAGSRWSAQSQFLCWRRGSSQKLPVGAQISPASNLVLLLGLDAALAWPSAWKENKLTWTGKILTCMWQYELYLYAFIVYGWVILE